MFGEYIEDERTSVRSKINNIIDNHIGSERESTEALKSLSSIYPSNSEKTRRNFKNEIEKRDLNINKSFLESFCSVKDTLNDIYNNIAEMNVAVENMASRLQDSKTKTHHLLQQTMTLQEEKKQIEKKLLWTNAFIAHFQLTPAENNTLHGVSKDSPITVEFFTVLLRIEKLYNDCKLLIQSGFETAALDVMERITLHQEAAIERLYRWTQNNCRNVDLTSNTLIPKGLAKLQRRQVLFVNVVDEYCTARKSILVRAFIDALTKGTDLGTKPIEFYADDAKRYIGDILAWVYQTIPVEKESLSLLFKECDSIDKSAEIKSGLMSITEAVCPPLKVRADIVLTPDKDPVTLCSITNLISYYKSTILEIIPSGQLLVTIDELLQRSEDVFITSLDGKIQKELSHGVKAPPSDLTPSPVVTDLLSFLREVLSAVNLSDNNNSSNVKKIVAHVVDPLLHAINETACHLSSTDMAVYLLNCFYHIQCTLSLYQNMDERNERLQAQSEAQIDTLTSEQASSLVANLNLGPIYTILQEQETGPLSAVPGMEPVVLKTFLHKFDSFIAMPDMFVLPQLGLLLSNSHRNVVQKRSFEVIVAIYKQLYDAVHNPSNHYVQPEKIVKRTPSEINQLLL